MIRLEPQMEALLETLGAIAARHGADRLLRAPFVSATRAYFPEPYEPSMLGVATVLHRLLVFAGLKQQFELDDEREVLDNPDLLELATREPRLGFYGVDEDTLAFEVEQLGPADLTVAALCHAVAHAVLLCGRPGQPPPVTPDARDIAVAAVFLGFGLLVIPGADSRRHAAELRGSMTVSRTSRIQIGGLPPSSLVFLLAVICVVREESNLDELRAGLSSEERVDFERWCAMLLPDADSLRRRLGTPMLSTRERIEPPTVPPLPDEVRADCVEQDELYRKPHVGKNVSRVWETNRAMWAMLVGMLGLVPMGFLMMHDETSAYAALPIALFTFVGAKIGAAKRAYYCGGCKMRLRATETSCPKCGASFVGDKKMITRVSEMED